MAKHRRKVPDVILLLGRIGDLWIIYVKGQLTLALIVGGLTWVVGSAIGLPGALWLGLIAGILETVPSLGPLVAAIPAIVVALWKGSSVIDIDNWIFALIVAGTYVAIQQSAALIIAPHLTGKRLSLPPLVVLIAVIVGAAAGNVVGALLAVPLLVTLREVVRFVWRKANGLPPFADDGSSPTSQLPPA